MHEGWYGDDYLVFFSLDQAQAFEKTCELDSTLPGFSLVGLRGWQDFIVRDLSGTTFTIPTVPLDAEYLSRFEPPASQELESDPGLCGKVRWLIKPLVFGGDPQADDNVTWLSHPQHIELVRWWNDQYRAAKFGVN
ncbi:hypothetical protein DVB37_20860 [Achromobacter sp. B7]|nr:hypothetical protein DVB37_20860 [Achromobacter sp. B7]